MSSRSFGSSSALFTGIVAASALACHRGAPPASVPTPVTQGVFEYEATAINQTLRGRIVIADSLVVVEPQDDECWRLPQTFYREEPYFVTFACSGEPTTAGTGSTQGTTRLRISLLRPTRDSRWGRLTQVARTQRVCTRTVRQGTANVCTSWADRRIYTSGWQWGNLHVKRAYLTQPDTMASSEAR